MYHCADVDECAEGKGWCPEHSTCMNTEGSYMCVCDDGYTKSGSQCVGQLLVYIHLYSPEAAAYHEAEMK